MKQIPNHISEIVERVIESAILDQNGIYWKTLTANSDLEVEETYEESLYGGVGGIIFFLLNYYDYSKDTRLEGIIDSSLTRLLRTTPSEVFQNTSFYSGKCGLIFLLLYANDVLHENKYLTEALKLFNNAKWKFSSEGPFDLLNGTAGEILGLLHLYCYVQSEQILSQIHKLIQFLILNARITSHGIYWGRSVDQITGLCGLSHGASGIAFVFLELYDMFGNEEFLWLAEEAFNYEDYWLTEYSSWPDLRKGVYTSADKNNHLSAFKNRNVDFFTKGSVMEYWCHGSAGIALARLRAYDLTNNRKHKVYAEKALEILTSYEMNSLKSDITYTLCHGRLGNALSFLYAADILPENQYINIFRKIEAEAITEFHEKGKYLSGFTQTTLEDLSLLMGTSGIGLAYLAGIKGAAKPNILFPLTNSKHEFHGRMQFNASNVRKPLLEKYFAKTISSFDTEFLSSQIIFSDKILSNSAITELKNLENVIDSLDKNDKQSITFEIEKSSFQMEQETRSACFINICTRYVIFNSQELANKVHLNSGQQVILNPNIKLIYANNSASLPEFLLMRLATEIVEHPLTKLLALILKSSTSSRTADELVKIVIENLSPNISKSYAAEITINQIKESIHNGLLIAPIDLDIVTNI